VRETRQALDGRAAGVSMPHPRIFWLGIGAITFGVAAHLPMFFDAADMHYRLHGMGVGTGMIVGMAAIAVGLPLTVVGLVARRPAGLTRIPSVDVRVEEGKVGVAHVTLLIVLTIAVVIDAMKGATLGFVAPGAAAEYGLKSVANPHASVPVALYPLAGAGGMSIGALIWGHFGDRVGRRAGILLAGVLFIATSICGAMPYFGLNLVMCTWMGIGVGGMIPITFALLAETIPARHRGFAMVMVGVAVAAAFALTSGLADWLIPIYSWRVMWLIGLPSGLLLILLNRWIPESPRFLVGMGRREEAMAVLRRFGARLEVRRTTEAVEGAIEGRWRQIVSPGYAGLTLAICLVGFSAGALTFGFQLWAPSNLPQLGVPRGEADALLRNAALIAIPVTALIAPAYGYWSSKRTIIAVGTVVAASLIVLAVGGSDVASHRGALYALVALPIAGASSLIMIVAAYSSEVYPTEIRARGGGAATSASRVGGVLLILLVVFSLVNPSMTVMSIAGAATLIVALAALVPNAIETRQRPLETITREELRAGIAVQRP
jgi:putative MFS transporter